VNKKIGLLLICLLFVGSTQLGYAAQGTFFAEGEWIGYKYQRDLGASGQPTENAVFRPVLMTFKHTNHGLGFGKLIWDGKRQIELSASIAPAQKFSVYPYHVRIVMYDPENKEVRNEHLSIGVTWQNYPWSGPSLMHLWKPGLSGGYSLAHKPLSELSKKPFGMWTIVFYKDMNLKGSGSGPDQWKWEPLVKYEFEIIDQTASGNAGTSQPGTLPLKPGPTETEVEISPLHGNDPITLNGVGFEFRKYDMQRYKEDNQWKWTINFCEVYADGELVAKISSEQMNVGDAFSKVIGTRKDPRTVSVSIIEMPKVKKQMECRGPVQPCWTVAHPVNRGQYILLKLSVTE